MWYYLFQILFHILIFIFFRYRIRGAENFPQQTPFIIASNHASYLDPALVGCSTWLKVHFMAREDLFSNKVFALWAGLVGCFPVSREGHDKEAIKEALSRLRMGRVIAIFPEGTRSKNGDMLEAKPGVGFLAKKAKVPVVPIRIIGSDKAFPKNSNFIRFKPIEVRVGKPIWPDKFDSSDKKKAYRQISQEVMDRISGL